MENKMRKTRLKFAVIFGGLAALSVILGVVQGPGFYFFTFWFGWGALICAIASRNNVVLENMDDEVFVDHNHFSNPSDNDYFSLSLEAIMNRGE